MDVVFGQGLAQQHFGGAGLGDARRVKRLVKVADHMLRHPSGTLPQKLENWAELMGLYRLMAAKQVTHQAVLEPHRQQVLERMREHDGVVLQIHDASELITRTSKRCTNSWGRSAAAGAADAGSSRITPWQSRRSGRCWGCSARCCTAAAP